MLRNLEIKNIAIIQSAEISFEPGFTVLTGETGSGKSIVVDCLLLIAGKPATDELIKHGESEAWVSATFDIPSYLQKNELISEYLDESETLILTRRLQRGKPGIAKINGASVPLKTLRQLTSLLMEITGQHETQVLTSVTFQESVLDQYGVTEIDATKTKYQNAFKALQAKREELKSLQEAESTASAQAEFLAFQIRDIQDQNFRAEEEAELMAKRLSVKHAHQLVTGLTSASTAVEQSLLQLELAQKALFHIAEIDLTLAPVLEVIDQSLTNLKDPAQDLLARRHAAESSEDIDIDAVESRLDAIFRYKTKYRVQSLPELLSQLSATQLRYTQLSQATESIATLESELSSLETEAKTLAKKLHQLRTSAAKSLGTLIATEMRDLGFFQSEFRIDVIEKNILGPNGGDDVQFLISTNPGEPLKPLEKIASGGELSRVMLALKSSTREKTGLLYIFDEIDAGIGGLTAHKIAEKLKGISAGNQVFCVTHLAQIAKVSDRHLYVEKYASDSRTDVRIYPLNAGQQQNELVRMIGGETVIANKLI